MSFKDMFKRIKQDICNAKWLILVAAIYWGTVALGLHRFCPVVQTVGFPCPGCGVTRGLVSLMLFRFEKAFVYNPTVFLWAPFFIYCFIYRYLIGKKIPFVKEIFIVLSLIMLGVYVYRMCTMFPSDKPLEFNEKNILRLFIPGYNEFIKTHFL